MYSRPRSLPCMRGGLRPSEARRILRTAYPSCCVGGMCVGLPRAVAPAAFHSATLREARSASCVFVRVCTSTTHLAHDGSHVRAVCRSARCRVRFIARICCTPWLRLYFVRSTLGRWGGSREDDPSEAEAKKKSLIEALNFPHFPKELEQVRGSCAAQQTTCAAAQQTTCAEHALPDRGLFVGQHAILSRGAQFPEFVSDFPLGS